MELSNIGLIWTYEIVIFQLNCLLGQQKLWCGPKQNLFFMDSCSDKLRVKTFLLAMLKIPAVGMHSGEPQYICIQTSLNACLTHAFFFLHGDQGLLSFILCDGRSFSVRQSCIGVWSAKQHGCHFTLYWDCPAWLVNSVVMYVNRLFEEASVQYIIIINWPFLPLDSNKIFTNTLLIVSVQFPSSTLTQFSVQNTQL